VNHALNHGALTHAADAAHGYPFMMQLVGAALTVRHPSGAFGPDCTGSGPWRAVAPPDIAMSGLFYP